VDLDISTGSANYTAYCEMGTIHLITVQTNLNSYSIRLERKAFRGTYAIQMKIGGCILYFIRETNKDLLKQIELEDKQNIWGINAGSVLEIKPDGISFSIEIMVKGLLCDGDDIEEVTFQMEFTPVHLR